MRREAVSKSAWELSDFLENAEQFALCAKQPEINGSLVALSEGEADAEPTKKTRRRFSCFRSGTRSRRGFFRKAAGYLICAFNQKMKSRADYGRVR
jgi:hypothetical protein